MRRVTGALLARLHRGERGSYVVTVAVLFVGLLALMALTIDTGMVYQERHELQNAADAGALAVAFTCARDACSPADAAALATSNAITDGTAGIQSVDVDTGAGEVTVVARSLASDGENSLYLAAARVFGTESLTVRARATAAWGPVAAASTIPYVISFCDLEQGLDDQGGYVDIPPPAGTGTVITFHDPSQEGNDCDGYPGFDMVDEDVLPGGFGLLQVDDDCTVQTYTDENDDVWAPAKTGTGAPSPYHCLQKDAVVTIPIFLDFRTAPDKEYRIGGYAAFYVTGWSIPAYPSPGPAPCAPSQACISGWFTEMTVSDGGFGDIDFGVRTARLTR